MFLGCQKGVARICAHFCFIEDLRGFHMYFRGGSFWGCSKVIKRAKKGSKRGPKRGSKRGRKGGHFGHFQKFNP